MEVQNAHLLNSFRALRSLAQAPLPGVHALSVRDALADAQDKVQRLEELRQDLQQREDLTDEEANEEYRQALAKTTDIGSDPIPEQAFKAAISEVQVSAVGIDALDWIIGDDE